MRCMLVVGALALSSCATTPAQVMLDGTQASFASARPAELVANCLVGKAQGLEHRTSKRMRDPQGGIQILTYAAVNGQLHAVVVADVFPRGSGSEGMLYISQRVQNPEFLKFALTEGC